MLTSLKSISLAACLIAGPIYADTAPTDGGDVPAAMTLTKLSDTLYSLTGAVGYADCFRIVPRLPDHPFTLILESPGGSLSAGVCLADAIKERDVITMVRDTPIIENGVVLYEPEYDDNGFVNCSSACTWLFFAGDVRYLMGDVYFGIHGAGIPADTEITVDAAYTQGIQTAAYIFSSLKRLGVPEDVRLLVLRIPYSEVVFIRPEHFDQLEGLRYIANHYVDFFGFTGTNPHKLIGE